MAQPSTSSQAIQDLESALGLPIGFLDKLLNEGDWSFVIKAHAFLEAALTHLLVSELGRPTLLDTFSRLELSNKATGKVAFLKQLSLLDEDGRRFISAFSELRNKLVHDVRNVSFSFNTHVAALSASDQAAFSRAFLYAYRQIDPSPTPARARALSKLVLDKPKICMWGGVLAIAHLVYQNQPHVRAQSLAGLLTELFKEHPGA